MMAKRTRRRILLTLAAGVTAQAALTGCGLHPGRTSLQAETLQPLTVRVKTIKFSPLRSGITFLGSVTPYVQTNVSPSISGIVSSVLVRTGDRVKRGQLLAVLDTSMLQAQLAQAQANLEVARAQLYADSVSAKSALTAAMASLHTAQAGVANAETQARNSVAQAKSSEKTQAAQSANVLAQYQASVTSAEKSVAAAEAQFEAAQVNQQNAVAQAQAAVATAGANLNAARYALSQQISQAQNAVAVAQSSLNAAEDQSNAQVASAQSSFTAAQANLNAAQAGSAAQIAADQKDIANLSDELAVLKKELSVTSSTYSPPLQISLDQTTIALNNAQAQFTRDQSGSAVVDAQAQLQSAQAALQAAQQAAPVGVAQAQLQQAQTALQAAQNGQNANIAAIQLQQAQTALQTAQSAPAVQVAKAQLQQAQAALQAARDSKLPQVQAAQLAQAQTAVKAAEAAASSGVRVAQDQAAQAQAALQSAQASPQADIGRAQVQAAQSGVQTAGVQLQEARVTAPISGYVVAVSAAPGQAAGPQAPIATLASSSPLMATVNVPQSQVSLIRRKTALAVQIPALGLTVRGTVLDVRPALNATTQSYPADVLLSVPAGASHRILPGMAVQAALETGGAGRQAIYVPADSVLSLQSGAEEVFVVRHGAAYAQIVQVGAMGNTRYQITSGLKPGEQVVVAGQNLLSNGDAVRIVTGPPGSAPAKNGRKRHVRKG